MTVTASWKYREGYTVSSGSRSFVASDYPAALQLSYKVFGPEAMQDTQAALVHALHVHNGIKCECAA